MLKPIEKQRVADEIVEQLRSLILTGKYIPGEKLPPERELAKQLGVNRASLREALKKLEHLGLVRIRQGDGTRVQNFMETAGLDLITHLVPLANDTFPDIIRDVLEFRRFFGHQVAVMAAERAEEHHIERLRQSAERAAKAGLDASDVFFQDFEFYIALTAAGQNRMMMLLINTVRDPIKTYKDILMHITLDQSEVCKHHQEIIAAVVAKDPKEAAAAVDRFMRKGEQAVLRLVDGGQVNLIKP